jgi:hypothetical protein
MDLYYKLKKVNSIIKWINIMKLLKT